MGITRRSLLRAWAGFGVLLSGFGSVWRNSASASLPSRTIARVTQSDDIALAEMMTSCVRKETSFHGKCGEWSRSWASDLIRRCPDSTVLRRNGVVVGFMEIPVMPPPQAPITNFADRKAVEAHALREKNRVIFRVTAAGIQDDLLTPEDAIQTFHDLMYHTFRRAHELGYEYVESFAPWEKHPKLAKRWVDYPGLEMVEPPSISEDGKEAMYWTRWRLVDALAALETEGATLEVDDED